jgi:hypothetical protein
MHTLRLFVSELSGMLILVLHGDNWGTNGLGLQAVPDTPNNVWRHGLVLRQLPGSAEHFDVVCATRHCRSNPDLHTRSMLVWLGRYSACHNGGVSRAQA